MADDQSPIAFSRTGTSCPLGKLDERVVLYLDEDTFTKLLRKAHRLGTTPSEFVRDLVFLDIRGSTLLELVAKHRRDAMQAEGTNQCQESAGS